MSGISVVVPTYNRAEMLRLTLDSIFAQSVQPLEIIVVDDGSKDHTASVCSQYGERVSCIYQKTQGPSAARNTGIKMARGEWIAFCDSDDLWRPDKLAIQLEVVVATRAGWAVTDFCVIDPDGETINADGGFIRTFPVFEEYGRDPDAHFSKWLEKTTVESRAGSVRVYTGDAFGMLFDGNIGLPSTTLMQRKVIAEAGDFDESFSTAEDTEFFHRISAHSPIAIVMKPLTEYRVGHPAQTTGDPIPFIEFALVSIDRASRLRPALSDVERSAFREGKRKLGMRLAYSRLSVMDNAGARRSIKGMWDEDRVFGAQSLALLMASLLPPVALRGLHQAKRTLQKRSAK